MSDSNMDKNFKEILVYLSPFMPNEGNPIYLVSCNQAEYSGTYKCIKCSNEIGYDKGQLSSPCENCGGRYFKLIWLK